MSDTPEVDAQVAAFNTAIAANLKLVLKNGTFESYAVWSAAKVEFDSLVADAARYRLMRLIATEPDAAKRNAMSDACDAISCEQFYPDMNNPTPEQYDAFADHLIAVANANR
jgi:hypothetical protein